MKITKNTFYLFGNHNFQKHYCLFIKKCRRVRRMKGRTHLLHKSICKAMFFLKNPIYYFRVRAADYSATLPTDPYLTFQSYGSSVIRELAHLRHMTMYLTNYAYTIFVILGRGSFHTFKNFSNLAQLIHPSLVRRPNHLRQLALTCICDGSFRSEEQNLNLYPSISIVGIYHFLFFQFSFYNTLLISTYQFNYCCGYTNFSM